MHVALLMMTFIPACLWDYDTMRFEANGLPGMLEVTAGYFDQYPKLYYKMRLHRVQGLLKQGNMTAEEFDNGGVALDRLGQPDEAIEIMKAKLAFLKEHQIQDDEAYYRYHANLGTFLAHRWLGTGKDLGDLGDMRKAQKEISKALEINPEAHFGRERYQLALIEYILSIPKKTRDRSQPKHYSIPLSDLYDGPSHEVVENPQIPELDKAIEGLKGLVVLGNAWQSPDVYWTLFQLLKRRGDQSLAYFVGLRCLELVKSGKHFLDPKTPKGNSLYVALEKAIEPETLDEYKIEKIRKYYTRLKQQSAEKKRLWTRYVLGSLNRGKHPDTHPDFWEQAPKVTMGRPPK